ncbi:CHAT domain-containing protein [Streptomyces sp. NPDC005863]|uniref:CHAT domain-containing protein n=1 Tax=unclassified Streptomyces TaxID=2593676 RepID=UPI0033FAE584
MAARRERAVRAVLAYEELRIRIRRVGAARYLMTANGPARAAEVIAVGSEPAAFRDQWDRLIATELGYGPWEGSPEGPSGGPSVGASSGSPDGSPDGPHATVPRLRALGRDVFRLLFGDGRPAAEGDAGQSGEGGREGVGSRVGVCVDAAFDRAQRMSPPRGLRIRFDLPPELRDLPLESLCAPADNPQQTFALNHGYSLVRSLTGGPVGKQRLPEAGDEPSVIRLLVACASPRGLERLRAAEEVATLRRDLSEVAVHLTVLERTTRARLDRALATHPELPTAVLLIAHGTYDEKIGKGVVALETENGGIDRVPADLLSSTLLNARRLRLVVLNLCSGADSSYLEPFSGLAQSLIGGGVPAVVAMRGRVSDVSAGAFSPELLKGIAANKTVDEAMAAARLRIYCQPQHTAVEWATPTLFLHEECRQGWLFKAREVQDDAFEAQGAEGGGGGGSEGGVGGRPVADPLREGAEALRTLKSHVGHVRSADLIGAARFQRDLGHWEQVQRILMAPTQVYADERRRMRAEAAFEQAWPELDKLCALLAGERDARGAEAQLDVVRDRLPDALPGALEAEVDGLRRLAALVDEARAAEAAADWATAIDRYEDVLAARPGGLRDVAERLAAARDELHVARTCEAAESARRAGDWGAAAQSYAAVLALRPGHRTATAWVSYVAGRTAEANEDWPTAQSAYAACAEVEGAAQRAAYARGRAAAESGAWAAARDAFAEAGGGSGSRSGSGVGGGCGVLAGGGGGSGVGVGGESGSGGGAGSGVGVGGKLASGHGGESPSGASGGVGSGEGPGSGPGVGVGVGGKLGSGHRGESASGADGGPRAGSGPGVGAGVGAESGSGSGVGAESGSGSGVGGESGSGGMGSLRTEAKGGSEAGGAAESETGAGSGSGSAFGPGAEVGSQVDCRNWYGYCAGRAADAAGLWDAAVAGYAAAGGFEDSAVRLLYARGRGAAEAGRFADALTDLAAAAARDWDTEPFLGELRRRVYEAALTATEAADWPAALTHLTPLPEDYRAVRALRRYAEGKSAAGAGEWGAAAEAFGKCVAAGGGARGGRAASGERPFGSRAGARGTEAGAEPAGGEDRSSGVGAATRTRAGTGAAGQGSFRNGAGVGIGGTGLTAESGADPDAAPAASDERPSGTDPRAPAEDTPSNGPGAHGTDTRAGAEPDASLAPADECPSSNGTEPRTDCLANPASGAATGPADAYSVRDGEHVQATASAPHTYAGHPLAQGGDRAAVGVVDRVLADAADLWRYARGRLCQARGQWDDALALFVGLPSEVADVPDRVLYARGRAADARGEWNGVIDGFGRLPDAYADGEVGVRRLYARARVAADLRDDWPAVLSLLTGVPDEAREGAVGALRRKAAGRRAEATGDWAAACEIYARAFPDGPPDSTAPTPSAPSVASAPPAPTAPSTPPAPAPGRTPTTPKPTDPGTPAPRPHPHPDTGPHPDLAPTPHPTPDPEALPLYRYALARSHEACGRWPEALGLYLHLDDAWSDVPLRRRYVRARVEEERAEGREAWQRVADAYAALERDHVRADGPDSDVAARGRYARVRAAEADADWAGVAAEADALGPHRDAPAVAAYARGRLADAHQEWQSAADAFRQCPGHRDADAHLAYAEGRLLEAAGRWSAAVDAYERAGGALDRADVRCRRLRRLIGLLPWADGLIAAPLVADPFAVRDQAFPYLALRDAGVDPGASMDVVKNASYALLERGTMSWHERVALERLRLPGRRLQLDALLYRWHSPDALREALASLSPDEGPGLLDALCARSPQDAPLLLLLARDRETAAAEWERRLKQAPGDMAVVHGLAAARLWQAQELEQSGAWEHAVRAWESALAYWATLLSDDEYWDGWRVERAAAYRRDLTHDDMASLRWELSQHLFEQLSAYEQRHSEQDRPQQAAAYQELGALLESELGGARVLKDVGGLPSVPGAGATLACGPRYLRLLHLQEPFAALAAELDAAAQQGKDPGEYAVRELRWAFSELARSFALCEVRKFESALRALPAFRTLTTLPDDCAGPAAEAGHAEECGHCRDFLRRNPAYVRLPRRHARLLQDGVELAVHIRLALAKTALTRGDGGLGEALEQWGELVKVSRNAGMQARSKKAVIRTVLGRVEALTDEDGVHLGGCLDEAVTLVESVIEVLHPLDRELFSQLNAKLSALLSMRGVWRGYTRTKHGMWSDMHGAEADLRRALALNPESSHARDNLARALVFTLDERTREVPTRLKLLHEALGLLDVGLGQALTHRYRETLGEALDELEKLITRHLGVEGMGDLIRSDSQETPPDDDDLPAWAAELTGRAERALLGGDILWALHHLIRATRAEPTDHRIRRALLGAAHRWLAELGPGTTAPRNQQGGGVA